MLKYYNKKIFIFGMEIAQSNTYKVLESIERKGILGLSMDFNGGIGIHLILHSTRVMQIKELTN
jgi:hypothetical protein